VAGIGNIYASEALFYARLHPARAAGSLTLPEANRLTVAITQVLQAAIGAGGSTLRDYRQPDGDVGFFQDQFAVYGRDGARCPGCRCGGRAVIQKTVQGGRSTYFCPIRQKP
jgi:formamidopyrimidine-DNA glycosylase